jgi:hypothetical protein
MLRAGITEDHRSAGVVHRHQRKLAASPWSSAACRGGSHARARPIAEAGGAVAEEILDRARRGRLVVAGSREHHQAALVDAGRKRPLRRGRRQRIRTIVLGGIGLGNASRYGQVHLRFDQVDLLGSTPGDFTLVDCSGRSG